MNTYTVHVHCSNCEHTGSVALQKGTTVADKLRVTPCPNCGCKTLAKSDSPAWRKLRGIDEAPYRPDKFWLERANPDKQLCLAG